jgi:hypothetical protein
MACHETPKNLYHTLPEIWNIQHLFLHNLFSLCPRLNVPPEPLAFTRDKVPRKVNNHLEEAPPCTFTVHGPSLGPGVSQCKPSPPQSLQLFDGWSP